MPPANTYQNNYPFRHILGVDTGIGLSNELFTTHMRKAPHPDKRVSCFKCPLTYCLDCQEQCKCGSDEYIFDHNGVQYRTKGGNIITNKSNDEAADSDITENDRRFQELIRTSISGASF